MITEQYRKDYTGEFVITNTVWSGGKKRTTREWIPNAIQNNHISNRAACIGSAADSYQFDYRVLQHHKGGLLGSLKLQTYGVGKLAEDLRLDFVVEKDEDNLKKLIDSHFYKNHVIYTTPRMCVKYPNVFYPIPYNPLLIQALILPYLAAFDGHKEVFMLGYTDSETIGQNDWVSQLGKLLSAYSSTKFYRVGHPTVEAEGLKQYANYEQISYRKFITHCDI